MSTEHGDQGAARNNVPSPPRWKGERSLELIHQLNERCLELLSQTALSDDTPRVHWARDTDLALLRSQDLAARRRIARLPFVVVDIHFMDGTWWRRVREPLDTQRSAVEATFFPGDSAVSLMHETLMFAWHAAQSDPRTACLTVGMSREVSAVIATLTMRDVRRIASTHAGDVAPRWHDWPDLWERMLRAAQSGDADRLADAQLQAKALLSGELLASGQ